MASTNGVLSPQSHSDSATSSLTSSAKRKRDDSTERLDHTNGIDSKHSVTSETTYGSSQELIKDLLDVLKLSDNFTTPSLLDRPLPKRSPSSEPEAKRQKPEDKIEPHSILTRFSSNSYTGIEEVVEDIDTVVSDMTEKLQLPSEASRGQYAPTPRDVERSLKLSAFKKKAHELVWREKAPTNKLSTTIVTSHSSNGVSFKETTTGDNKMVLTLYGNAPGPKQLFSSLQMPSKLDGDCENMVQPLREAALPNGISTTKVTPFQSTGLVSDKKHAPTLGEVFPTPSTVPPFQPPRPSKIATTRSSTVGWYQPANAEASPRNGSYFRQTITTGHWLDYSNAGPSSGLRRKQRDRAASLSGIRPPQIDLEPAESEAAKLDALFRSAYSGFAPTKDDAAAIVPDGLVNRVWWQRIGEKSFDRLVENANNLEGVFTTDAKGEGSAAAAESSEAEFKEAVEQFSEEVIDPNLKTPAAGTEESEQENDVEEVLQGISELLETLNSYQRIRHMSLSPPSRVGLLSGPEPSAIGTPPKPNDSEMATYEILKSQLSLLISTLPPFAVAKLNSDQLAELSISTKIEVKVDDYKGVMEEDEAATRAKVAAMSAVSNTSRTPATSSSLHRTSSTSLYGNQYATQRNANATAYYGSQTPNRPPSSSMQRPPSTAPVPYQSQRPASTTPYRPTYGTPSYPHQNPRPTQQSYTPSTQQYSAHNYMRSLGQNIPSTSQAGSQSAVAARYSNQSYPYQTQSTQYGNGLNLNRQPSPQKPLYSPQTISAQPTTRPSYSTPTSSMSRPYVAMGQNSTTNGGSSQSPLPQQSAPYASFMTSEQQSAILERQRAQLAQQQNSQQQARNAAQAALGSPQKSQVNGSSAVAAGL